MSVFRNGFITAQQARQIAIGGSGASAVVLDEIQALQTAILTAANTGKLQAVVSSGTTMTTTQAYFDAYFRPGTYDDNVESIPLQVAVSQMNEVISYFTLIGYAIRRDQNGTASSFKWTISW